MQKPWVKYLQIKQNNIFKDFSPRPSKISSKNGEIFFFNIRKYTTINNCDRFKMTTNFLILLPLRGEVC